MNGYDLANLWFDFVWNTNEKVNPIHHALFHYLVYLNNRLGWKEAFGVPTMDTVESLKLKRKETYLNALKDLSSWGVIEIIEWSKNQHSATRITLNTAVLKNRMASVMAKPQQVQQHCDGTVPIDKPLNLSKPINQPNKVLPKIFEDVFNDLANRFNAAEKTTTHNAWMAISAHLTMIENSGLWDGFVIQYPAYFEFCKLTGRKLAGYKTFFGELGDTEGVPTWKEDNWKEKLDLQITENKPQVGSGRTEHETKSLWGELKKKPEK